MSSVSAKDERLGCIEFVSAINGDDPIAALRALRRFVRTVRKERKLALWTLPRRQSSPSEQSPGQGESSQIDIEDSDDMEDYDDDDLTNLLQSDATGISTKKRRRAAATGGDDSWKMDTAGYNVPFVGTSAIKGSVGVVQSSVWPCGLLKAYLDVSPRAVELLDGVGSASTLSNQLLPPNGSLHKPLLKSGKAKLSQMLHRSYLEALGEVASAIVTKQALLRDMSWQYKNGTTFDQDSKTDHNSDQSQRQRYDSIASALARDHLPPLMHLLNEQCSQSAVYDAKHSRNSGGNRRRVGPLTSTVLQLLSMIASSGIGAAREVVRGLDSELRDGALRSALAAYSGGTDAAPAGKKQNGDKKRKASDADAEEQDTAITVEQQPKNNSSARADARTAALRLCSVLLEMDDPTVRSFTCSPGSRERRSNAGVVHTALRVGLVGGLFDSRVDREKAMSAAMLNGKRTYLQEVGRFLAAIRDHILPLKENQASNTGCGTNFRLGLDERTMLELINGDVMDNLMRIVAFAPYLDHAESYRAVISATDVIEPSDHTKYLALAALQCRRLLFTLLGDADRSPFLLQISSMSHKKDSSGRLSPQENLVTRALLSFVSNEDNFPTRSFILHCLRATPALLLAFFRSLPMPDPKPTFKCLSALAFASNIITDGPSLSDCIAHVAPSRSDQLISLIIPTSLSKSFLTKALQSTNAFLVAETLRVICDTLKRTAASYWNESEQKNSIPTSLGDSLQKRLPDLQILLALRSKFDPFLVEIDDDESADEAAALSKQDIVTLRFCDTLQLYGRILPSSVFSNVKFDWTKLLPDDLECFFSVSSTVQVAVLKTFDAVAMRSENLQPKAFLYLLMISLSSTSEKVHSEARKLSISYILGAGSFTQATGDEDECFECLKYEASLWVDVACDDTAGDICKLLAAASQNSVQHKLCMARAWSTMHPQEAVPSYNFSSLLSSAIAAVYLSTAAFSPAFVKLVCQIAVKSLLFHRSPELLASYITFCSTQAGEKESNSLNLLQKYSVVVNGKSSAVKDSYDILLSLVGSLFEDDSVHRKIFTVENGDLGSPPVFTEANSTVVIKHALHRLVNLRGDPSYTASVIRLHNLIQNVLAICPQSTRGGALRCIFDHPYTRFFDGSFEKTDFFVSLSAFGDGNQKRSTKGSHFEDYANCWLDHVVAMGVFDESVATIAAAFLKLTGSCFSMSLIKFLLQENVATSKNKPLLYTLLLEILGTSLTEMSIYDATFPAHRILSLWTNLVYADRSQDNRLSTQLFLKLGAMMSSILRKSNKQGLAAAKLASCILEDIEIVLGCAFKPSVNEHITCNLLAAAIEYDSATFAPKISTWIASADEDALERIGEKVDGILISYVIRSGQESTAPSLAPLLSLASQRANCVLQEEIEQVQAGKIHIIKEWIPTLPVLLSRVNIGSENDEKVLLFALVLRIFEIMASKSNLKLNVKDEETVLGAAVNLLFDDRISYLSSGNLWSYVLLRLGALLPRALRKGPRERNTVGKMRDHSPIFILNSLVRMLKGRTGCYNVRPLVNNGACLRGCFVGALKYGIRDANASGIASDIAARCLTVCRLLVVRAGTDMTPLSGNISLLKPAQVHTMVISHSNFQEAIAASIVNKEAAAEVAENEFPGTSSRYELIKLLICCASLSHEEVAVGDEAWNAIMSCYSAGVTKQDKALRRLLYLYSTSSTDKNEDGRFLSEYKWGGASESPTASAVSGGSQLNGSDHARHYEWFIQALDIRRVRSTLMSYPIWDRLVPDADQSIEPWAVEDVGDNAPDDESNEMAEEEDSEQENDDDSNNTSDRSDDHRAMRRIAEEKEDLWSGHGADDRYSPPFVLSLILATLEAFDPPSASNSAADEETNSKNTSDDQEDTSMDNNEDPEHRQWRESYVKIAKRLCDKGSIALVLSALSSKCPDLRSVAVSILGLFIKAVQLQEAHELKSWRERPQIEMILNSVQRGLAVRRAISIARRDEEGTSDQPLLIPMLPAVSAVFLGWTSLIIMRPSDDMFASANRSYLRLEEYHGAYKDCFALPAFITLFCGSFSEDNSQARRERLWALQLLKDGTRDSYCYKVAARRHVPALIMTTFDSLVSRGGLHANDAEPYLLLEALEGLIVNGGRTARLHLIANVGIFSWIRGLLVAREHSFLFPSVKMLRTVILLIAKSFRSAIQQEEQDSGSMGNLRLEAFGLAGPLVRSFMQCIADVSAEDARNTLDLLVDALDAMTTACLLCGEKSVGFADSFRVDGIEIASALELLHRTRSTSKLQSRTIRALSFLPLSLASSSGDTASNKDLCIELLSFVDGVSSDSAALNRNVLIRLSHVVKRLDQQAAREPDLPEALLSCRMVSQQFEGGTAAFKACLESLSLAASIDEDNENEIAEELKIVSKVWKSM